MQNAVGVIETLGFPGVLAAADAMVKAARITLVSFDLAERGNFFVVIRGPVSEVKASIEAGLNAARQTFGSEVISHYIVPNPPDNIVAVLPIEYTEDSEEYRT